MSVKKIAALATIGIVSIGVMTATIAGGAEYAVPNYAGVYIEANAGYVHRPWQNDVTTIYGSADQVNLLSSTANINGGFTGGADLGYQFNQFVSIEGGWYYLPRITGTFGAGLAGVVPASTSVTAGLIYAAFKGMAPVYANTYIFGKLGTAYTYNHANAGVAGGLPSSNLAGVTTRSNFWSPMLAAGIQYYFTPSWSANVQYAYVPGYRSASANRFIAPDAQLITAGVGYKILM